VTVDLPNGHSISRVFATNPVSGYEALFARDITTLEMSGRYCVRVRMEDDCHNLSNVVEYCFDVLYDYPY
jgi:hypothetical protein